RPATFPVGGGHRAPCQRGPDLRGARSRLSRLPVGEDRGGELFAGHAGAVALGDAPAAAADAADGQAGAVVQAEERGTPQPGHLEDAHAAAHNATVFLAAISRVT